MSEITRTPLCWPNNVARTAPHLRGAPRFDERTLTQAAGFVTQEINRLNERRWDYVDENVIISSNLRLKQDGGVASNQVEPADTGIAVYFKLRFRQSGKVFDRPIVMTCDKWRKSVDNLYAIGKDIEAQRARARWGCTNYQQAFQGYVAIPERCGGDAWWIVLGVASNASQEAIKAAYKAKAAITHPDKTSGSQDAFNQVQEAYKQALASK